MPCFVRSLALTAFKCSALAVLGFMGFCAFSTVDLDLTGFGLMIISIIVEALCQLHTLYISFRSVHFIIDTETSFDPGI